MQILIVTPAPVGSLKGNRITALRWAAIFRQLGHRVKVSERFCGQNCELMIALHAKRSASSIYRYHLDRSPQPLVLALTGTDLYEDIKTNKSAQRSLDLASRLVVLQKEGVRQLPRRARAKVRVIYQSVPFPPKPAPPLKRVFQVCVIGHLRMVKDPFRAAQAARRLPPESRIRIVHIGMALSDTMRRRACAEMDSNGRYRWLGQLPRWQTMQRLARSRLLVLSSKIEGGANVVCEAVAAGIPILSTRISGSVGILGGNYPGYFPVGDTQALADLLLRVERDPRFYASLKLHSHRARPLIDPTRERLCWQELLGELVSSD